MGSFIRLPPRALDGRIDATYYRPEYVANAQRLASSAVGCSELSNLVSDGRRTLYFGTTTLEVDEAPADWVPFLTSDDLGDAGFFIETRARRRVAPSFLDDYPAGRLRSGELLVKVKGPNQTTAYIDTAPEYPVLVSGTIWGGLVRKEVIDPYYLVAALSCPYAAMARTRLRTNLNVEFLGAEDLLSLSVPTPDKLVQRYIGDKVRRAARLRERARIAKEAARSAFERDLKWSRGLALPLRSRRIAAASIGVRLDANFNSPSRLRLADHLREQGISTMALGDLADVSAMIGWKGLTTEHYVNSGPWLLRGTEIDDGLIRLDELVSIEQAKYDEQPQIHLRHGDVAMTKDGTIGRAIVVPLLANPLAAGSTVARLRLRADARMSPYYLEHVLNHHFGQLQIASFATGMAQPHITQEWIGQLQIPRIGSEQTIGQHVRRHHEWSACAVALLQSAVLIIERLIDAAMPQSDLIAAQRALEAGDATLDRSLLQALRRGGAPNAPLLFPDIDSFFALLDESEGAQDA